jgi:hypothetical protein
MAGAPKCAAPLAVGGAAYRTPFTGPAAARAKGPLVNQLNQPHHQLDGRRREGGDAPAAPRIVA